LDHQDNYVERLNLAMLQNVLTFWQPVWTRPI